MELLYNKFFNITLHCLTFIWIHNKHYIQYTRTDITYQYQTNQLSAQQHPIPSHHIRLLLGRGMSHGHSVSDEIASCSSCEGGSPKCLAKLTSELISFVICQRQPSCALFLSRRKLQGREMVVLVVCNANQGVFQQFQRMAEVVEGRLFLFRRRVQIAVRMHLVDKLRTSTAHYMRSRQTIRTSVR